MTPPYSCVSPPRLLSTAYCILPTGRSSEHCLERRQGTTHTYTEKAIQLALWRCLEPTSMTETMATSITTHDNQHHGIS